MGGTRNRVWAREGQRLGWGHREAELLLGSFGRDDGPVPTLGKGQGRGRSLCSLALEGSCQWKVARQKPL